MTVLRTHAMIYTAHKLLIVYESPRDTRVIRVISVLKVIKVVRVIGAIEVIPVNMDAPFRWSSSFPALIVITCLAIYFSTGARLSRDE